MGIRSGASTRQPKIDVRRSEHMTKRLNALLVPHGMQDRLSVHFLARQMLSRGRPVHRVRGKQSVYSGLLSKVHADLGILCLRRLAFKR